MYEVDIENIEELLRFSDLFPGETLNVVDEIKSLNMHKTITIISELIRARNYKIEVNTMGIGLELSFELALKKMVLNIKEAGAKKFFKMPVSNKNKHIISLQMLLILLKKVLVHGDSTTLEGSNYVITEADYIKIIQLQLIVAESFDIEFEEDKVDIQHFIYANYHLNYDKNVANAFARSFYMLEKISKNKDNFDIDVQKEYRNYYKDFTDKYNYTPSEYLSLLFWELSEYYPPKNKLIYGSSWRNLESVYGNTDMKELSKPIISDVSRAPEFYVDWCKETDKEMWDFSLFNAFPFLKIGDEYISISEYTLKNTFFEKLFWNIRGCYDKKDDRCMAFYGRLFEKYIQNMTESSVLTNDSFEYVKEFEYGKENNKSSDAYIKSKEKLIIIECKGFSVLQNSIIKNKEIDKNNKKLFVDPILQADNRFFEISSGKYSFTDVSEAMIISVTMDNVNAVPGYLEEIYSLISDEKKSDIITRYFNLNIEEYEMLMFLLESKVDIYDVLCSYYDCVQIAPFSSFLHSNVNGKIKIPTFLQNEYNEATNYMRELY